MQSIRQISLLGILSSLLLLEGCVTISISSTLPITSSLTSEEQSFFSSLLSSIFSNPLTTSETPMCFNAATGQYESCDTPLSSSVISSSSLSSSLITTSLPTSSFFSSISQVSSAFSSSSTSSLSSSSSLSSLLSSSTVLDPYYYTATGLKGLSLKAALHDIIDGHTMYPYTSSSLDVWDALKYTDEDPNNPNNIILLYTGRSINKSLQDGSSDQCTNDCWNREHVWSKSHGDFGETKGPGTDLHHLRPADKTVNSTKGNLDFDDGGTQVGDLHDDGTRTFIDCYSTSNSFEPRDEVKGDVARMIFYMAVRYEGDDGFPNLEIVDQVGTDSMNAPLLGYYGKLSTLLRWNLEDRPDAFEIRRNNRIQEWQHNRNPFIDYPDFATLIWG